MEDLMEGVSRAAEEVGLPLPMPPASLIGVAALYAPDIRVEIEVTALIG